MKQASFVHAYTCTLVTTVGGAVKLAKPVVRPVVFDVHVAMLCIIPSSNGSEFMVVSKTARAGLFSNIFALHDRAAGHLLRRYRNDLFRDTGSDKYKSSLMSIAYVCHDLHVRAIWRP